MVNCEYKLVTNNQLKVFVITNASLATPRKIHYSAVCNYGIQIKHT